MRNPTRIKTIPRNIFAQKQIKISAKSSSFFKLSDLDFGPSNPGENYPLSRNYTFEMQQSVKNKLF